MAIQSLNGKKVQFSLLDENGNVLGSSSPGATNYTAGLNNFVAPDDATYYVSVTGDPGVQFNLVVTRGADFMTQPNNTISTAQDITATEQSGDNKLGGVLGYLSNPSGAVVGVNYRGHRFQWLAMRLLASQRYQSRLPGRPRFDAEAVNTVEFRV